VCPYFRVSASFKGLNVTDLLDQNFQCRDSGPDEEDRQKNLHPALLRVGNHEVSGVS
jgi:hypothetical protein